MDPAAVTSPPRPPVAKKTDVRDEAREAMRSLVYNRDGLNLLNFTSPKNIKLLNERKRSGNWVPNEFNAKIILEIYQEAQEAKARYQQGHISYDLLPRPSRILLSFALKPSSTSANPGNLPTLLQQVTERDDKFDMATGQFQAEFREELKDNFKTLLDFYHLCNAFNSPRGEEGCAVSPSYTTKEAYFKTRAKKLPTTCRAAALSGDNIKISTHALQPLFSSRAEDIEAYIRDIERLAQQELGLTASTNGQYWHSLYATRQAQDTVYTLPELQQVSRQLLQTILKSSPLTRRSSISNEATNLVRLVEDDSCLHTSAQFDTNPKLGELIDLVDDKGVLIKNNQCRIKKDADGKLKSFGIVLSDSDEDLSVSQIAESSRYLSQIIKSLES